MTAASIGSTISGSRGLLAGELIDSLLEAVVLPTDAFARSEVICDLIYELCDAVDCLHAEATLPDESIDEETASLRQLLLAAHDHQRRMESLSINGFRHGGER